MHFSLIALSLAAALPLSSAAPTITGSVVNCREGPGTQYDVVRTYKQGEDLKISCEAAGEDIEGNKAWDKTADGCYVTDFYVKGGGDNKKCDDGGNDGGGGGGEGGGGGGGGGGEGGGTKELPGLDKTQSKHAQEIVDQAKKEKLGNQGCLAGITTALVESNIYIYANKKVPESMDLPHDKVGSDHDSVGIFQQRARFYPDIKANMDPAKSASQFFEKMKGIEGWKNMEVGKLCQKVQVSAFPDRYAERVGDAKKICKAGGM